MMTDDRLESLLRSAANSEPLPPRQPDLTERVLETVARRRSQRQRRIVAAALVGCYLGGMLTVWIFLPPTSTQTDMAIQIEPERTEPSPVLQPDAANDHRALSQHELPAEIAVADAPLETSSESQQSRYELFRELGDASHTRGDFASAVRYYRLALDSASETGLQAAADDDNLLLLSLKQDRVGSPLLQRSHGESL